MSIDSPSSLDVWKDRLLLLGFRKGPDNKGLPDASMAWLGSLTDGLKDLRPVLFSASAARKNPLGLWNTVEAGKVRFLENGSFVIVPGVEPGVYLYTSDARLARTWDSAALGIDVAATDSKELALRVAADLVLRGAFVNARRIVDEILPLAQGPALVVRRADRGTVHWTLKLLRPDGSVEEVDLPLEVNSQFWHVAGDVRGNKIMILLKEFAGLKPPERTHPRLVELEVLP